MLIEFKREVDDNILDDLFANYPEAGSGAALQCVDWDYKNFKFTFVDAEDEVDEDDPDAEEVVSFFGTGHYRKYVVTKEMAIEGFKKFVEAYYQNRFSFYGLTDPLDADYYDADSIDAVLQYTLFGELIYG
jgi:hypothetical protein